MTKLQRFFYSAFLSAPVPNPSFLAGNSYICVSVIIRMNKKSNCLHNARGVTRFPVLFVLFSLLLTFSCQSDPTRKAIERQLQQYPETRVQDIYKSFCQDNLGPGHLIPDPDAAKAYLQSELAAYREDLDSARYAKPAERYVPVGDAGNYVRVDLSVVLDSLVDEKVLLNAFVRSANEGKKLSIDEWKSKWASVATIIRKDFPIIPDASNDLAAIDSLMTQGHWILHHSHSFNKAYHPHYRIVARDIFDNELKPQL